MSQFNMDRITIYKDSRFRIWLKEWHVHKLRCRPHRDFCPDYGDIPVVIIGNNGEALEVVNNRGQAYGLRNAKKFRNKKRYNRKRKFK